MIQPQAPKTPPVIEILHLDEMGYGPNGSMTRRDWRELCLENLNKTKEEFKAWQEKIKVENTNSKYSLFDLTIDRQTDYSDSWCISDACTLDFAGQVIPSLKFDGYEFELPCSFYSAIFGGSVSFERAFFKSMALFSHSKFIGNANFENASFAGDARFESVIFSGNAVFDKTRFNSEALFRKTEFQCDVYFLEAVFSQHVNFKNCIFEGKSYFWDAKFTARELTPWEIGVVFFANFQNAIFKHDTSFHGANFEVETQYTEAEFYGDAEFNAAKFSKDVRFFRVKFGGGIFFNDSEFHGEAARRLGQMKLLAETSGATDQALNFNALELQAKMRLPNSKWWFRWVTKLYELFSDFGRSFAKPIIWYSVLICFGALLAMGYSTYIANPTKDEQKLCLPMDGQPPPLKLSYERAVFEYAMFRAGGVMDFTDTGKQNNAVNCRLFNEPIEPPVMRGWGVFKGIASIALLFLAALGLRNKYRIK